jgi:type II secretory pathway pseudopilin PulG
MKITKKTSQCHKSGMTLLELTVVILVLLSLIGILFIGARGWKRGTDRASCILNHRITQQAVRSYQNMYGFSSGQPIDMYAKIIGPDKFLTEPSCPSGGSYTFITYIPLPGELAMTCSLQTSGRHIPDKISDW